MEAVLQAGLALRDRRDDGGLTDHGLVSVGMPAGLWPAHRVSLCAEGAVMTHHGGDVVRGRRLRGEAAEVHAGGRGWVALEHLHQDAAPFFTWMVFDVAFVDFEALQRRLPEAARVRDGVRVRSDRLPRWRGGAAQ